MAVSLPVEVRAWAISVIELMRSSNPQARWVDPGNMHITLKFMGWLDDVKLDKAIAMIAEVAATHRPTQISVSKVGAFPRVARARVVYLGLIDPDELLVSIADKLDASFEALGVPSEAHDYLPHLTLARFKRPARVEIDFNLPPAPAPFLVEQIDLYRSHLSPKGARYEKLSSEYLGMS